VTSGAMEVPFVAQAAMQETEVFVKKSQQVFQQKENQRCYKCVGQDAGKLLLSLSSQAGAIPMLQGVAEAFSGTEVTLEQFMGCTDAVAKGAAVVKSMEISLRPPKGVVWRLNRVGPMAFVNKLKEMADSVHVAQEVLQSCQPELPNDKRVDAFKDALQLADDVTRNGQALIILGIDVAKKIQAMSADAGKGDWKAVGLEIGSIADSMSAGQSGLAAVGHFLADVTGRALPDLSKVRGCMQESQSFLRSCHETFTPLPARSAKLALQRLHDLLDSAEEALSSCQHSVPRELGHLMPPEMRVMAKSLDAVLKKADHDTGLLLKGYDLAKDASEVAAALKTHNYGEASEQMAVMLGQINDNLNGDSFLKGLLTRMGSDLNELSSVASCVGDTKTSWQRIISDLRTAGRNLEISPRKWTIDKQNCDAAMSALKDAVQAIHEILSSCSHEIEALKQLLQALMRRQWDNAAGKIQMFQQNIGEPLWQLAQAIGGREWSKAGEALAKLALTALHAQERNGTALKQRET